MSVVKHFCLLIIVQGATSRMPTTPRSWRITTQPHISSKTNPGWTQWSWRERRFLSGQINYVWPCKNCKMQQISLLVARRLRWCWRKVIPGPLNRSILECFELSFACCLIRSKEEWGVPLRGSKHKQTNLWTVNSMPVRIIHIISIIL